VSYTSPCETLAATASRLNFEALPARVVIAHPRVTLDPCTCGLRGGAAAVAAALIGYNVMEVADGTTTRRRRS
jgi:rhodanese-related sulfurtransferase